MKLKIKEKLYDTENATEIAYRDNGNLPNDLFFVEETLYQDPDGEYFLGCVGGAGSIYCDYNDDGSTKPGVGIKPLPDKDAELWLKLRPIAVGNFKKLG